MSAEENMVIIKVVPPSTVEEFPTNTVEQSFENTVETANEDASKRSGAHIEDAYEVRVIGGSQIQSEAVANNDEVGPIDTSLLMSFKFHRVRSITLGQPETNNFYFKWGEMTPTLDDVEQLIGFATEGDATVIGKTWGFPALLEVFEKNLLLDLKGFKALKAGGTGNSLSLKKLRDHYAYKLEKVLSDSTVVRAKKKGLSAKSVAHAYMLYVLRSFLFPTKRALMSVRDIGVQEFTREKYKFGGKAKILNWTSKYKKEAARVTEETNDLHKKLINAEEMNKFFEEVWRQSLKKVLASEGMRDM
ncbi:hypothetical protein GIB67_037836 [Kingdonia uniflora]|uniref:Aminotransferase-like plant mobile domain-containing protein n=1 Tax=Kingdonia uniflora TaxID=39325 RepID=A0A7J7LBB5_9MAGN|nr:hypothetical protein GIB67_037836 [Kingdonia uniflora]